jgi:hypothetical protein
MEIDNKIKSSENNYENKTEFINTLFPISPKKNNLFYDNSWKFIYNLCPDIKNIPNLVRVDNNKIDKIVDYFDNEDDTPVYIKSRLKKNSKKSAKDIQTFFKKDMILVKGDTQSGKEKFTVSAAIRTMLEGRTPLIITRNITDDINKLERGISNYSQMFRKCMKQNNVDKPLFQISSLRIDNLDNLESEKRLIQSLNRNYPLIVLSLGNENQLGKFLHHAKNCPSSFDIYIDEIDKVDYGRSSKIFEILSDIKYLAYQVYGITATPLDSLFSEEDLNSANILQLSKPNDYRGFIDITVKLLTIDPKTSAYNKVVKCPENILKSDGNLKPFLDLFSQSKPEFAWTLQEHIPNICLIKNTRINENQEILFQWITKEYKELVVILNNRYGIKIYFPNMSSFYISKKLVKENNFTKVDITSVLQYLKDNGGVEKFPNIVIIAGELAGRCISYVSKDYGWHLTDMYYNPSKGTQIPEMIQSCGRLCGRNRGKSHLHLYATRKVADALYKGFHFTNEIISRAIESPKKEINKDEIGNIVEKSFFESMKSIKINEKKFPKGRKITSKIKVNKKEFNLVSGEDGGYDLSLYNFKKEKGFTSDYDYEPLYDKNGKYYYIDEDRLTVGTTQFLIIDEVIKQIIDHNMVGKNIHRTIVNEWLLKMNHAKLRDVNHINGSLDTNIIPKMEKVSNNEVKGLLYWRENGRIFFRYNL